uniref:Uncharacterized protein n=1 Tax=Megaviridae environmental sample TaxID=1737588 RepID=A0A5J6VI49_9VIRU|nr:MAG: hypothetical protein [Megaviridae environmental sample]
MVEKKPDNYHVNLWETTTNTNIPGIICLHFEAALKLISNIEISNASITNAKKLDSSMYIVTTNKQIIDTYQYGISCYVLLNASEPTDAQIIEFSIMQNDNNDLINSIVNYKLQNITNTLNTLIDLKIQSLANTNIGIMHWGFNKHSIYPFMVKPPKKPILSLNDIDTILKDNAPVGKSHLVNTSTGVYNEYNTYDEASYASYNTYDAYDATSTWDINHNEESSFNVADLMYVKKNFKKPYTIQSEKTISRYALDTRIAIITVDGDADLVIKDATFTKHAQNNKTIFHINLDVIKHMNGYINIPLKIIYNNHDNHDHHDHHDQIQLEINSNIDNLDQLSHLLENFEEKPITTESPFGSVVLSHPDDLYPHLAVLGDNITCKSSKNFTCTGACMLNNTISSGEHQINMTFKYLNKKLTYSHTINVK